jgi:hypothetical protein
MLVFAGMAVLNSTRAHMNQQAGMVLLQLMLRRKCCPVGSDNGETGAGCDECASLHRDWAAAESGRRDVWRSRKPLPSMNSA